MAETVIANWQHHSHKTSSAWVYPDGCRDLIMRQIDGGRPIWYMTTVEESARVVEGLANKYLVGFRFHPATIVNETELISRIQGHHSSELDMQAVIDEHSFLDFDVQEALDCLSTGFITVESAASTIGVSVRTLQRKLLSTTGKTPTFWLSLARARKASGLLALDKALAGIASECGYSDQAHFTREIRRWFHHTPAQIRNNPQQLSIILAAGYCSMN